MADRAGTATGAEATTKAVAEAIGGIDTLHLREGATLRTCLLLTRGCEMELNGNFKRALECPNKYFSPHRPLNQMVFIVFVGSTKKSQSTKSY